MVSTKQIAKETGVSFSDARKLKYSYGLLDKINDYDAEMRGKTDAELANYTSMFRLRIADKRGANSGLDEQKLDKLVNKELDQILPEAYAVVREAARRVYGDNGDVVEGSARADPKKCEEIFGENESAKFGRHYDAQMIGGVLLHQGYVSEMYTGEGKTLVATLPAYLNALDGKGVHIVTANDYLAKRDAKWMSPLFKMLGMDVGTVHDREEDGSFVELYSPDRMLMAIDDMAERTAKKLRVDTETARMALWRCYTSHGNKFSTDKLWSDFIGIVTTDTHIVENQVAPIVANLKMSGIQVTPEMEQDILDSVFTNMVNISKFEAATPLKKQAYACDITYGTSTEMGFDYLRDNIAGSLDDKVQRKHNYALIDEIDNILIDDASTPLIRSTPGETDRDSVMFADKIAQALIAKQKELVGEKKAEYTAEIEKLTAERADLEDKESREHERLVEINIPMSSFDTGLGSMAAIANLYRKDIKDIDRKVAELNGKLESLEYMPGTEHGGKVEFDALEGDESPNFYFLDPKDRKVGVDEEGLKWMEKFVKMKKQGRKFGAYDMDDIHLLEHVNSALKAHMLFQKDVDYVVEEEELETADEVNGLLAMMGEDADSQKKIVIVDEGTGRKMPGRRWSYGLHEAVEAKEKAQVGNRNDVYGVITLPFYFAKYKKKAGMTGTARSAEKEFKEVYGMPVVQVPTHKPVIRHDHDDLVYASKREKLEAIADEITAWHSIKRPVLVGTRSIEDSETLADILNERGIEEYEVLNARKENIERESEIVAKAGKKGAITIATNMAGRGTDISLEEGVTEIGADKLYDVHARSLVSGNGEGGLVVLGTERHDSRRVDNQLKGRSGRQGDPGTTRFYTSLEDALYWFVPESWKNAMSASLKEGEGVQAAAISKAIAKAQGTKTENQAAQRKQLVHYDKVLNKQRDTVYGLRDMILERDPDVREKLPQFLEKTVADIAEKTAGVAASEYSKIMADKEAEFSDDFIEWVKEKRPWYKKEVELDEDAKRLKEVEDAQRTTLQKIKDFFWREDELEFDAGKIEERDLRHYLIEKNLGNIFACDVDISGYFAGSMFGEEAIGEEAIQVAAKQIADAHDSARDEFGKEDFDELESGTLLGKLDKYWKDHLESVQWLRDKIWMRSYAQKDPKMEYGRESSEMFWGLMQDAFADTMRNMMHHAATEKQREAQKASA